MLVVSRKENESIRIEPVAGLDPALTLREAFAGGAITVRLQSVGQKRVRLVIEAPAALKIMRTEVSSRESAADGERGAQPSVSRAGQG